MESLLFPTLIRHAIATPDTPFPPGCAYEYLWAQSGIFLRAESPYLAVQLCITPFTPGAVRGLPSLTPHIHLHHPRIPNTLLQRVLDDARTRRNAKHQLVEALYRVVPRLQEEKVRFALTVPLQKAARGFVATDTPTEVPPCLELHSHGALSAFWSSTDDKDEGGIGFYAVVGRLDQPRPEIRLRLGVYGYWWEVPLGVLFEEHDLPPWEDVNAMETYGAARWQEAT